MQIQMGQEHKSNPTGFKKFGSTLSDAGFGEMGGNSFGDMVQFVANRETREYNR